ncbi:MAG: Holliday junction resolvase RuvX [Bacteroidia bacterium]|nr:Holliday junction resolvase RuvX [Bacteroidia bacterium]MBP9688040.1 Holliday junction resolvase RuvX [Bacteroidia bacterium]
MPRILAIDYGTKRVGLAVTDPLKIIASALDTVHAKDVMAYLKKYTLKEVVDCFVVGLPKRLDGTDSQSAVHVDAFVTSLQKNFPNTKIVRVDERFTSTIATRSLLEMGLKKKDRANKSNIDQVSAVLILQTYMEMI